MMCISHVIDEEMALHVITEKVTRHLMCDRAAYLNHSTFKIVQMTGTEDQEILESLMTRPPYIVAARRHNRGEQDGKTIIYHIEQRLT